MAGDDSSLCYSFLTVLICVAAAVYRVTFTLLPMLSPERKPLKARSVYELRAGARYLEIAAGVS